MDADTRVIGKPWKEGGGLDSSNLERTPANKTIANKKPRPQPKEFTIDSKKL